MEIVNVVKENLKWGFVHPVERGNGFKSGSSPIQLIDDKDSRGPGVKGSSEILFAYISIIKEQRHTISRPFSLPMSPPLLETVSQSMFLSFRPKGEILLLNDMNSLRFLTYVRNDSFPNCDTVS